jgi:hypothetical protein
MRFGKETMRTKAQASIEGAIRLSGTGQRYPCQEINLRMEFRPHFGRVRDQHRPYSCSLTREHKGSDPSGSPMAA